MTEQIVVRGLGGVSAGSLLLWAAAALGVVLLFAAIVVISRVTMLLRIIRTNDPTGDATAARPAPLTNEGEVAPPAATMTRPRPSRRESKGRVGTEDHSG